MALLFRGQSTCPICEKIIAPDAAVVMTSAFLDSDHPLWQFNDAAMHYYCFANWHLRTEFIRVFNEYWEKNYRGMCVMLENGQIQEREPRL
jgi:hypothetical protein